MNLSSHEIWKSNIESLINWSFPWRCSRSCFNSLLLFGMAASVCNFYHLRAIHSGFHCLAGTSVPYLKTSRGTKVTVYLQMCHSYKRFSLSGLNCRYLSPYMKLKITELAILNYTKKFETKELKLHVRANFAFRQFNLFLSSQCGKKTCRVTS